MSKLVEFLKTSPPPHFGKTHNSVITEKKKYSSGNVVSPETEALDFNISDEDLATVKSSVVNIDTDGLNRKQIVIGMYGSIKNPQTGDRFVIPGVDFNDEEYIYRYAEMMRTLVNRPDDFKKIMNWE